MAAARTAIGKFGGALANTPATQLGARVILALLEKTGVEARQIDECQVLTAGTGQTHPA